VARRAVVGEILARGGAASQEELQQALAARGIHAAQPTISRDLVLLGASRLAAPGGPRYAIPAGDAALPIEPVRGLVEAIESNGLLIVVRTKAGAASTIARALDDARLEGVLGTIAGDDTIFVAPQPPRAVDALVRRMRRLFAI
jgi:transcriptional regulator of arginine metabolism